MTDLYVVVIIGHENCIH